MYIKAKSFLLYIVSLIILVSVGPENITIFGSNAVDTGNLIHLTCTTESIPESTYTWTVNGKEIPGASYIKEQSEHEDSGIYTCTAWNSITNHSQKVDVDVSVTGKVQGICSGDYSRTIECHNSST